MNMKKFFFFTSLCLISCSEIETLNEPSLTASTSSEEILENINSYIAITHENHTRVNGCDYNISPFILDGDTVFYVANYDDGWQIFSNSSAAPMVLATSATGNIDLNDETFQDSPMYSYIEGLAEDVHYSKSFSSQRDNRDNPIIIDSVLWANTRIIRIDTISVSVYDHLLETKWGNKWPWNEKCRIMDGQHVQVGCGAVAIGQYLYYQHKISRLSHLSCF